MKQDSKKILVMSLGRGGGCAQYLFSILKHFTLPYMLYQTKYAIEDLKEYAVKIPTYHKNKISFLFNSIFLLPFILFRFYKQAKSYDVLFLPYFHFWNLAFIFIFKWQKKPIILIEHDGIIHSGDELLFQQYLINACIKNANTIIFLTHYVKNRINPKLLKNKKVFIIPHGIFAFKGLQRLPKTYNKKPNLLFFGRVNRYKGIEILLQALEKISLHSYNKLIIAGKSSYKYDLSPYSKAFLQKLEIIDTFLTQNQIASIFNQSHILIMPYIEASQSGVASIAIANAIPCICTDVGGLKEQFIFEAAYRNGGGVMKNYQKTLVQLFANLTHNLYVMPLVSSLMILRYMRILLTTSPCVQKS
ncbi:glycosyltransferase family 4 protein [Helicobacter sp. MIT 14-3879]|uniref:glycosyltransferase family 4 protein n=1 Tax=Helicobacter sp. MIT 14-3879 TaxID=2040649 RepID=UPI000E1E8E40|nr:glycosyltransferase family 4 protein [Helicobacter sp. MIT 14-3879]RDU64002.1 wbyB [Helicobacter sp. MIT 14-3879]